MDEQTSKLTDNGVQEKINKLRQMETDDHLLVRNLHSAVESMMGQLQELRKTVHLEYQDHVKFIDNYEAFWLNAVERVSFNKLSLLG